MKKKNNFLKPTGIEKDIEETVSSIVSAIPSSPEKVEQITRKIRGMGEDLERKRKKGARGLIRK